MLIEAVWSAGLPVWPVKEVIKSPLKPVCKPAMTSLDDQLKPASSFQKGMCKISNSLATIGKYLQTTVYAYNNNWLW